MRNSTPLPFFLIIYCSYSPHLTQKLKLNYLYTKHLLWKRAKTRRDIRYKTVISKTREITLTLYFAAWDSPGQVQRSIFDAELKTGLLNKYETSKFGFLFKYILGMQCELGADAVRTIIQHLLCDFQHYEGILHSVYCCTTVC